MSVCGRTIEDVGETGESGGKYGFKKSIGVNLKSRVGGVGRVSRPDGYGGGIWAENTNDNLVADFVHPKAGKRIRVFCGENGGEGMMVDRGNLRRIFHEDSKSDLECFRARSGARYFL